MIGYGQIRACSKAAQGARFRRKQHLGTGGDHDSRIVGASRRGLRSLAAFAWPGSRGLSENFIAVRGCGTIRPGFSPLSRNCWRRRHFDVLLPIHEQGFLFARARQRLRSRVGLALPDFESYRAAHSKAGFSRLLDQLGLPQPATRLVKSADELRAAIRFPSVVKTSVGTASRGVWFVRDDAIWIAPCAISARQISAQTARSPTRCWCRNSSRAPTEKAQAVFCRGKLTRLPCLSANCRRRGRRRGDQAKRQPAAACARMLADDRREARLARRIVGRLCHAR